VSSTFTSLIGEFIATFTPGLMVTLSAGKKHQGLIEDSMLVEMDRAHLADIVIRHRLTVYASSPPAVAIGEFTATFPPVLLVALSAVKYHLRLIEESMLIGMDRAHGACILI
jgi:predicted transcriptional regulator